MKSTLKNMVVVLLVITFVAATAVGVIYNITKGPIAQADKANKLGALGKVLPQTEITNNPSEAMQVLTLDGIPVTVYTAINGETPVGYAVETATKNGFSGEFRLMVGFTATGEIVNIEVLSHNETPGLGSNMTNPDNVLLVSFQGKSPADLNMAVKKDGGDIDALTASTITSRAYVEAVGRAYDAMQQVKNGGSDNE